MNQRLDQLYKLINIQIPAMERLADHIEAEGMAPADLDGIREALRDLRIEAQYIRGKLEASRGV